MDQKQYGSFRAVEKARFYPQTPQGGLDNLLDFNKSPLGDLGVVYSGSELQFSKSFVEAVSF